MMAGILDYLNENAYLSVAVGIGCGVIIGWIVKGSFIPVDKLLLDTHTEVQVPGESGNLKLVLAVRNDLKMGKGKIAAQCGHASVMAYRKTKKLHNKLASEWEEMGEPKVVVKVNDGEELNSLAKSAHNCKLITNIVQDAGRTQIAPGSRTVLAIGPGPCNIIDKITGHLKLL